LGAHVVVTARDANMANVYSNNLKIESDINAKGVQLEVTNEENWYEVVHNIVDEFGKIDILVNNAGGRSPKKINEIIDDDISKYFLEDRSLNEWKCLVDTNLTSVFLGCKAVAPFMKKQKSGKIINIASIDGMVGRDLSIYKGTGLTPTVPDYLASKAGVINLTRGIAVVLAAYNINVNCISPGGFFRNQNREFVENYIRLTPLGRMGQDGVDIKGAIAFLASSASDFVVGHNLVIDGGWTAW